MSTLSTGESRSPETNDSNSSVTTMTTTTTMTMTTTDSEDIRSHSQSLAGASVASSAPIPISITIPATSPGPVKRDAASPSTSAAPPSTPTTPSRAMNGRSLSYERVYLSPPGHDHRKYWSRLTRAWMTDRTGFPMVKYVLSGSALAGYPEHLRAFVTDSLVAEDSWLQRYEGVRASRISTWQKFLARYENQYLFDIPKSAELKSMIRLGIPPHVRGKVWMETSGAAKYRLESPGLYQQLVADGAVSPPPAMEEIQRDLHRTYPDHPVFQSEDGVAALRRVLTAFALRSPCIGYCQSLNFIAALLLLYLNEEDVFWLLSVIVEKIMAPSYYEHSLMGVRVDQSVLQDLLRSFLPEIGQRFDQISMDVACFSTGWFMCIFAEYFPPETTFRIWDTLFNEGAKILFRISIAFLKMNQVHILECKDLGDTLHTINLRARMAYDCERLLKEAFGIRRFQGSILFSLRERHLQRLTALSTARQSRRASPPS